MRRGHLLPFVVLLLLWSSGDGLGDARSDVSWQPPARAATTAASARLLTLGRSLVEALSVHQSSSEAPAERYLDKGHDPTIKKLEDIGTFVFFLVYAVAGMIDFVWYTINCFYPMFSGYREGKHYSEQFPRQAVVPDGNDYLTSFVCVPGWNVNPTQGLVFLQFGVRLIDLLVYIIFMSISAHLVFEVYKYTETVGDKCPRWSSSTGRYAGQYPKHNFNPAFSCDESEKDAVCDPANINAIGYCGGALTCAAKGKWTITDAKPCTGCSSVKNGAPAYEGGTAHAACAGSNTDEKCATGTIQLATQPTCGNEVGPSRSATNKLKPSKRSYFGDPTDAQHFCAADKKINLRGCQEMDTWLVPTSGASVTTTLEAKLRWNSIPSNAACRCIAVNTAKLKSSSDSELEALDLLINPLLVMAGDFAADTVFMEKFATPPSPPSNPCLSDLTTCIPGEAKSFIFRASQCSDHWPNAAGNEMVVVCAADTGKSMDATFIETPAKALGTVGGTTIHVRSSMSVKFVKAA